jgi:hypothetical protein
MTSFETVPVDQVSDLFGWADKIDFPLKYLTLPLTAWEMDADDVILRHVFRNFRPGRHLEFGTWLGDGVLRCVEECDATVWTINLAGGESDENGRWIYAALAEDVPVAPVAWSETMVGGDGIWVRTDAHGLIGRKYLNAGWGTRVCQIYSDSRAWDTRNYPAGFFDSAFIDGGHAYDIVENDTKLAIELVRPGGLIMWHDFCPLPEVTSACSSTRGVVGFVSDNREQLDRLFERLFWVQPSWLLFGIRRR